MSEQDSSYFYYPTTTIIIDDNKEFLRSISLSLNLQGNKLVKTFSDPKQALSYFKNQNNIYKNYQNYLEVIEGIELDSNDRDRISKINFNSIYTLPYDEKRYDEVSVIIADYLMPQMNGIDFFKKVENIPARKILMTGNADYKLAVNAFNEGLIDRFIVKDEDRIEKKLFKSTSIFKKRYFQEFSEVLLRVFDKGIKTTTQYSILFSAWCAENKIIEYYQCDSNGSCFGFDKKGKICWLLICSEKETLEYITVAEDSEEKFPALNDLKSRKKLLFFLTETDKQIPLSSWKKNMFPIHGDLTIDNEKYFYSIVSDKALGINLEKVAVLNIS